MMGAVLLLGIGVVAFPVLFETQPRPIPVDLPIEIPRKEGTAPLTLPASAAPPLPVKAPAVPSAAPVFPPKADTPASAEAPGRFVVQVGAFAEAALAREARAKVEKLGLRTYTQVVETEAGKRIRVRVGPFASRDAAEQSAAKVKAAGLPAAVLTL